jgi:hypothetical protein
VDGNGLSVFDLLRYRQHDGAAVLCAFDLIELDGTDLRPSPIEACLRARLRGHRLETARLFVAFWPGQPLAQNQVSESAGGKARGGRRLGRYAAGSIMTRFAL